MATFDYAGLASDVTDLLEEMGTTMTLTRPTTTGSLYAKTETTTAYSVTGAAFQERVRDRDGTYTGQTRSYVLIAPDAPVTPRKGDRITLPTGGDPQEVTEVKTLAPAGTVVYWRLELANG